MPPGASRRPKTPRSPTAARVRIAAPPKCRTPGAVAISSVISVPREFHQRGATSCSACVRDAAPHLAPSTVRRDNQLETALAWNLRAHSHHQKLSPNFTAKIKVRANAAATAWTSARGQRRTSASSGPLLTAPPCQGSPVPRKSGHPQSASFGRRLSGARVAPKN